MDIASIIREIQSDENKARKAEHQKRRDIYNDYQRPYVLAALEKEFSRETVSDMRTCTSINLCKRIINELASIYKREPSRVYNYASDSQSEGIEELYEHSCVNKKLKEANQKYRLHQQCAIQVVPMGGKIKLRVLAPHQYDVIPDPQNSEEAFAYVISTFDKSIIVNPANDIQGNGYASSNAILKSDGVNSIIADKEDYESEERYIIWTKEENILCTKKGAVIQRLPNPIGMLPFIDVAAGKDCEFFVRSGSGVSDFCIDFLTVLSDTCNTSRLQSYGQPVIVAEKVPESLRVGPNHILFLPIDPARPEATPSFSFANPNPDIKSSLELQDRLVAYFLSAQGIDPKVLASQDGQRFSSGLERLLAMVEKFEASQDDIDLFRDVEQSLFKLLRAWYTVLNGTLALDDELSFGEWPESIELHVMFSKPEVVQTKADTEDSVIKRLEAGLISRLEAIMELRGVDEDKAKLILEQMNQVEA